MLYQSIKTLGRAAYVLPILSSPLYAQDAVQGQLDEQSEMIEDLTYELESMQEATDNPFGKIDIHGFLAQGYATSSANNYLLETDRGSLAMSELGINFGMQISPETRVGLQLFSRILGDLGKDQVTVDWALVDHRLDDALGFRFGKVKVPLGLYNETRDIDMLRNPILLPSSIYSEEFRDALAGIWGIGTYGSLPGSVDYQMTFGTTNLPADGGIGIAIEDAAAIDVTDIDNPYSFVGSLRWNTPIEGLLLSFTALHTQPKALGTLNSDMPVAPGVTLSSGAPFEFSFLNYRTLTYSAEYTRGDLVLMAEYAKTNYKQDFDVMDPTFGTVDLLANKRTTGGYYGGASYRFNDWFQLGGYYSVYYNDLDDRNGDNAVAGGFDRFSAWQKDAALTARFDLSDNIVFKVEAHRIDGTAQLNAAANPDGTSRRWNLFLAKLSLSF